MAKSKPIDDATRQRVLAAIAAAWDDGCPVAGSTTQIHKKSAAIAIRRWQSLSRRGISLDEPEQQIQDIARGLVQAFEKDRRLVGNLFTDYQYLASKILAAIQSSGANRAAD